MNFANKDSVRHRIYKNLKLQDEKVIQFYSPKEASYSRVSNVIVLLMSLPQDGLHRSEMFPLLKLVPHSSSTLPNNQLINNYWLYSPIEFAIQLEKIFTYLLSIPIPV